MKDLYDVLGVGRGADATEIKKKYRKLTQQFHPDKNPGDKAAEERFKDVSVAYEVLGDPDKRKLYDEFGEMSLTQGFDAERARAYKEARAGGFGGGGPGGYSGFGGGPGFSTFSDAQGTSFDDLLSQIFGGGRVRDPNELFGGGRGRGRRAEPRGYDIEGEVTIEFLDALLGITVPLRIDGSGGGRSRTLDVKIPPGISEGSKLRVRGQGGGEPPGDVILTVHVRPHKLLTRDGLNLQMDLPVTALEAYRGGPIDVPTATSTVTIKLAPGSQNGQVLRLKGKGVSAGGKTGDLLIKLDVRMPAGGSEKLLEVLEELQAGDDPRANLTI